MAHAIWKGAISFGLVTIPVELFSAVTKNEIAFHLLDSRDMAPVRNERVNATTGEEVAWDSIAKGYQLPDGRWITMTDEDFSAANVKATRTIDVLSAVCEDDVPDEYFETPYFLAPEQQGRKAYALLREALRTAGRIAIGQIVIRSRQRLCALIPHGDVLMLVVMRYAYELRSADDLDLPSGDLAAVGVTDAETMLAAQLVATIKGDWDPSRYRDSYHDDLLALIARKAEGETIEIAEPAPVKTAEVIDIMDLLKRSIEDARASTGA
ncbi:MAG: Ku protein [Coriobacteriia bacterium]|nr:Ku protein [Coriobacteriia bacterium]